jgi:hypothetical protein
LLLVFITLLFGLLPILCFSGLYKMEKLETFGKQERQKKKGEENAPVSNAAVDPAKAHRHVCSHDHACSHRLPM